MLAQGDAGPGLYLVDLTGTGVSREAVSTIDPTRGSARISFDGAPAELLGAAGQGLELLARIQERSAILLAFEQLGGADRCLEMARDYALERYAFGRPIGSYQAIKHKLADVFVKNEVARANAYYGAWALSTDAPELPLAAAAARVAGSAAYWLASKEMIQTHGGIGVTWEADCHFFFRRARHLGLVIGAPREWKRRLADQLEERVDAEKAAMNFDDNPQEAAYRAKVRAWIEANAPDMSVLAPEERRPWQEKHKAIATHWQATKADAGYACISWPKERGGAGGTNDRGSDLQSGRGARRGAIHLFHDRAAHAAARADGVQHRRGLARPRRSGGARRRDLVPAVLRTFERIGFGGNPDHGGARRRSLGDQRAEGLEQRRAGGRLWHDHRPHRSGRAQAQGPDARSGSI